MLFSRALDPVTDCKTTIEEYKSCMGGYGFKVWRSLSRNSRAIFHHHGMEYTWHVSPHSFSPIVRTSCWCSATCTSREPNWRFGLKSGRALFEILDEAWNRIRCHSEYLSPLVALIASLQLSRSIISCYSNDFHVSIVQSYYVSRSHCQCIDFLCKIPYFLWFSFLRYHHNLRIVDVPAILFQHLK